jgi:hypothetical protein
MVCSRRVVLCSCLIGELKLSIVFDRELKLPIVFDQGVEVADHV